MLRARNSRFFVLVVLACFPTAGGARTVTEIIFGRNTLDNPLGIAVDDSGNVYVTGGFSDNAFKIELCDTLADYPLFAACLTGPEVVADPSCACPDDDADADVDLTDFARFQQTFAAP